MLVSMNHDQINGLIRDVFPSKTVFFRKLSHYLLSSTELHLIIMNVLIVTRGLVELQQDHNDITVDDEK